MGFPADSSLTLRETSIRRLESYILSGFLPRTATAFTRFDPITAPNPDRPDAKLVSDMITPNRLNRSPAGPIHTTLIPEPNSFLNLSCVAYVSCPT
jgi:hypothetical protein